MKNIVLFIYTMLLRLRYCFRGSLNIKQSRLWCVRVSGSRDALLCLNGSQIRRTMFNMNGNDNQLTARDVVMDKCEIRVNGMGNTIEIEPQCNLHNTVIVINGNNCRIAIGRSTAVGSMYMVCMGQANFIKIGEDCMIADHVDIWNTDAHPIYNEKGEVTNLSKPIKIGNHVWIGKHAKVLKGITIHDNAVVGMSTIVTKDVPTNTLVAGSDCRIIRSDINWDRKFITV